MAVNFPPTPASLKVQHYMKTAAEHDGRDIIVSYWCRLYALQCALKNTTKQPDENEFLLAIMDWLEKVKKENSENEGICTEMVAQAHIENYAIKLFQYADRLDRASDFGKNVVKAFYTSGMLYDVLQTFGELNEESIQNRKYAKWKAAYIHNCLKMGETPIPGPLPDENTESDDMSGAVGGTADDSKDETPTTPDITPNPISPPPTAAEVLDNPDILPKPPIDEERSPGGFVPYVPSEKPDPTSYVPANVQLAPEQIQKAQKYCKYASSALNFDDVKSAIDNLQKGLHLLQTGQEL